MNDHLISLCEAYRDYFYIGAAVNEETIRTHDELIRRHFNSITAENSMKLMSIHPEADRWDFALADELVDYAQKNNLKMRGHTFVWDLQAPDWLLKKDGAYVTREELLARYDEHIRIAAEHFPTPYAWDIVNEAIENKGGKNLLRVSPLTEIIGEDFIEQSFLIAAKYIKNATLFYNDYDETFEWKCDKFCELIKKLKESCPIGGLGLQGHYNMYTMPIDDVKRSMERYAKLGLPIHITELDVPAFDREDYTLMGEPTAEMRRMQEDYYDELFKIYREYREVIECVTLWGVADDATWLSFWPIKGRNNVPLLFDENHRPKPVFDRVARF